MMKKSWQRAFSFLLTLAMVLSLLVAPAGAITEKTWDFQNKGTAEGFTDASFEGVTVGGEFQSGYGAKLANGQTIVFPVEGACDIKVHVKHNWKIWINDDTANAAEHTAGGGDEVVTFHYNGAAGDVTLNTGSMSWVADIALADYTLPPSDPEVKLGTDFVELESTDADGTTVTAAMENDGGKAVSWTARSSAEGVARASAAADGTVTVTPVGDGTATITVKGTLADGTGEAEATFDVEVWTSPVTSWNLTSKGAKLGIGTSGAGGTWRGLSVNSGKWADANNGVAFFSVGSIGVPVSGPSKITVIPSYNWSIQLGDDESTKQTADGDNSSAPAGGLVFHYTGEAGTATLKAVNSRTWIKSVKVEAEGADPGPETGPCDTPGCILDKGHAGDHNIKTSWTFENDVFNKTTEGYPFEGKRFQGLTFHNVTSENDNSAQKGKPFAILQNGSTISVPVTGACDVKVTYNYDADATVGVADGASIYTCKKTGIGAADWPAAVYHYAGTEAGAVVITGKGGSSYVEKIEIITPATATGAKVLDVSQTADLELEEEATAAVSVFVQHGTSADAITVASSDTGAVTVSEVAGGKFTVTGAAEGESTVTVRSGSLEKTFKVTVTSATPPEPLAVGAYDYHLVRNGFPVPDGGPVRKSVVWEGEAAKWNTGSDHGPQSKADDSTVKLLLAKPEDGKVVNVTFETCGAYSGVPTVSAATGAAAAAVAQPGGTTGLLRSDSNDAAATAAYTVTVSGIQVTEAAGLEVAFTFSKGIYVHGFTVEHVTPIPTLNISKDNVALQMGKTETAEITATKANSAAAVKAESKNEQVATAAVNGDKVTITAVGAGETTVDIFLEGATNDEAKKSVAVKVDAEDTVYYIAEGAYNFQGTPGTWTMDNIETLKGLDTHGAKPQSQGASGHGLCEDPLGADQVDVSGVIQLTVNIPDNQKARLTFEICGYSAGQDSTKVTVTSDKAEDTVTTEYLGKGQGHGGGDSKSVVETKGTVTVTFTAAGSNKGMWIHSMNVDFLADDTPAPVAERRVRVWDFGGKVEANTGLYINNITPETLKNAKMSNGNPSIVAGIIKVAQNTSDGTEFGDVVFAAGNNDKFFSNIAELADLAGGNAGDTHAHDFGDGYTSAGGFITNGGGNASRRNVTVRGVKKGEVVTAYLSNNQADTTFEVEGHGEITPVKVASREFGVLSFVAPETGSYKIWANGGKPGFLRVTVTPQVCVTGKVTAPAEFTAEGWSLKFVDAETRRVTEATVDAANMTYTAQLAPGRTYNVSLVGARGWGIDAGTRTVAPVSSEITAAKTHDVTIVVRPLYTYSGTITGFAEGYDLSGLVVTMVPDEASVTSMGAEPIELSVTGSDFTADLDPSVKYTVALEGANDYQVKVPAQVTSEGADLTGQKIEVEAKALQAVSGKLLELDVDDQFAPLYPDSAYKALSGTVTKLEFENVDDGYVYPAAVKDGSYTASLRAGSYLAKATAEGFSTQTHVVVDDKAVSRDLLFVSTATPAGVDYAADIYVGDAAKTLNFKTITGALAYIARMERADDQRVTVHIAPGTYREQISINVKNVTFVNAGTGEVKLSWYYGIGYTYYSAKFVSGTECWYDPQLAFDRYAKADADVARWGATVRVRAPGFRAENITFENSFNYYVTDEEVYDGVVPNGKEAIAFARDPGADVKTKAATERAAAIWVDTNNGRGDMTEFKSCKFLSSQDTFGTGKRMYMKNCYIEGMTDFICGPGDCVFDTCVLNWKGYSEKETAGYLTAPQTGAAEKGYLFRNCFVSGDTKLMLVGGALGRTWGAENTKCLFLNTTLQSGDMVVDPTWVAMQGYDPSKPGQAVLLEYGTQLMDGAKVDLSKRAYQHTVMSAEDAAKVDVKSYFGDWTPVYYVEETATVAFEKDPYITDNGDINLPYPGHTLTVNYSLGQANDANDASVIKWYAVKDGKETLVKSSFANADKTYKLAKTDIGAQIKVEVTPTTLSGKTGAAKTATLAETVRDGYDDPTGATDPELGDGVNIFLAGDSTVKHYGAVGMYQNGKVGKEGSWGEFLQNYFNEKVTVVNYANGGRSTRNFINEGSLDKIAKNIKEGDYLFIQFGHNDCANDKSYIDDRYVPLGDPDANGVYPVTPGTKGADGKYAWNSGGTYKWFLQQYIDVAKKAGAIPVLVTPVARMYYGADGSINPHHDASLVPGTEGKTEQTNTNKSNTYCTAVRQLAQEQNVLLIDGFELTKQMYEDAYKAGGNDTYGQQVMAAGDKTHSNKLGGMVEAALIARTVQNMGLSISKAVKVPNAMTGKNEVDATVFTVDAKGQFTAYDMLKDYAETAPYWMGVGQKLLDAIAGGSTDPDNPDNPDGPADKAALTAAIAAAEKKANDIYTVSDDTKTSDVNKGTKFVTESAQAALADAIAAAKAVAAKADATEAEIAQAVAELKAAVETFDKAVKTGTKGGSVTPPASSGGGRPATGGAAGGTATVTNPDGSVATVQTAANGDKTITVKSKDGEVVAEVTLPASIPTGKTAFTDVPAGHWAQASIDRMAGLGMVKGVSEDTYDMVSPMTRGAIATIFFRLSNGKDGKTAAFADVAENAWYKDAVGWAAATGVVVGYSETAFGPDDSITRQQLAVMIARYARLLGLDTAAGKDVLNRYADAAVADDWALDSLAWCVDKGIVKGRGGDVLDPTAAVTRAEAAVMLDRMIGLIK